MVSGIVAMVMALLALVLKERWRLVIWRLENLPLLWLLAGLLWEPVEG
jgi:hypothetical protein